MSLPRPGPGSASINPSSNSNSLDVEALAAGIEQGDRRALAQAITLVESRRADHRTLARTLVGSLAPPPRDAVRVAVSGAPGVGKSTFVEALGRHVIAEGFRPAVLTVDPTSELSGGSILGDKTRMTALARDPRAFVRPSPSGGSFGGVNRHTRDSVVLCEAAGHDPIIIETVGVGQAETAVSAMTDMLLLLLLPGGGDDLQGIKRGIMELADLVLVNKADGELEGVASATVADYASAIRLLPSRSAHWSAPVQKCSALTGVGIESAWQQIESYRERLGETGEIHKRREKQAESWMWSEVEASLKDAVSADPTVRGEAERLRGAIHGGTLSPPEAASRLVEVFLARPRTPG